MKKAGVVSAGSNKTSDGLPELWTETANLASGGDMT